MNLRKALLDATQHLLVPINLQVRMQAALHQHTGAAQLHSFANFVVNGFEIKNVSFFCLGPLEGTIEGTESAVLRTEIRVINVAINNVSDHAVGMQLAANRISLHADADQIV